MYQCPDFWALTAIGDDFMHFIIFPFLFSIFCFLLAVACYTSIPLHYCCMPLPYYDDGHYGDLIQSVLRKHFISDVALLFPRPPCTSCKLPASSSRVVDLSSVYRPRILLRSYPVFLDMAFGRQSCTHHSATIFLPLVFRVVVSPSLGKHVEHYDAGMRS